VFAMHLITSKEFDRRLIQATVIRTLDNGLVCFILLCRKCRERTLCDGPPSKACGDAPSKRKAPAWAGWGCRLGYRLSPIAGVSR
jgi:hypothetical protein